MVESNEEALKRVCRGMYCLAYLWILWSIPWHCSEPTHLNKRGPFLISIQSCPDCIHRVIKKTSTNYQVQTLLREVHCAIYFTLRDIRGKLWSNFWNCENCQILYPRNSIKLDGKVYSLCLVYVWSNNSHYSQIFEIVKIVKSRKTIHIFVCQFVKIVTIESW